MNKITHFRELQGHKLPVLRLYRTVLKHIANLPLSGDENAQIRRIWSNQVHKNTNMMAGFHAKRQLNEARRWARLFRLAIEGDCKAIESVKQELQLRLERERREIARVAEEPKRERNYRMDPRKGTWLDEYNRVITQNLAESPLFRASSRQATNRGKAMRKFTDEFKRKYDLDEFYIDSFIVPDFCRVRELQAIERRKKLEMSRPLTAVLSTFRSPFGPFSYLRLPGKRTNSRTMQYMHNYRKDVFHETRHNIDDFLVLAQCEDDWEDLLSRKFGQPKTPESYTTELRNVTKHRNQQRTVKTRKLMEYRKVLELRKLQWDRALGKSFPDRVKYWKEFQLEGVHNVRWSQPQSN